MGLCEDTKDLKEKSIKHEALNKWFSERNENDPKFLCFGDGENDKPKQRMCWLLLSNDKRGFIIVSTKKHKSGFMIGDTFVPYKILDWGLMIPCNTYRDDVEVDHIDKNTLNNHVKNLRLFDRQSHDMTDGCIQTTRSINADRNKRIFCVHRLVAKSFQEELIQH